MDPGQSQAGYLTGSAAIKRGTVSRDGRQCLISEALLESGQLRDPVPLVGSQRTVCGHRLGRQLLAHRVVHPLAGLK